jgi:hypothetical protein
MDGIALGSDGVTGSPGEDKKGGRSARTLSRGAHERKSDALQLHGCSKKRGEESF